MTLRAIVAQPGLVSRTRVVPARERLARYYRQVLLRTLRNCRSFAASFSPCARVYPLRIFACTSLISSLIFRHLAFSPVSECARHRAGPINTETASHRLNVIFISGFLTAYRQCYGGIAQQQSSKCGKIAANTCLSCGVTTSRRWPDDAKE